MGAWGLKSFENDDAADWVYAFEENGPKIIPETFAAVENPEDDYLDAFVCTEALAAAEIVAAAKTSDTSRLSEEAAAALKKHSENVATADNVSRAREVAKKIREESELRELWEESDEFADWQKDVEALEKLLAS